MKFIPQLELGTSPITKSGGLVMSRIGSATQKQGDKLVVIHGSWQVEAKECIELLKILDEKDQLFSASRNLRKLADEMRKEIHDIWEAVDEL